MRPLHQFAAQIKLKWQGSLGLSENKFYGKKYDVKGGIRGG